MNTIYSFPSMMFVSFNRINLNNKIVNKRKNIYQTENKDQLFY